MSFPIYKGNCPRSVSKDAKYTIRSGKKGPVVGMVYETSDDERWYPTSDEHPELVSMVNAVKTTLGGAPQGSFYINEYKQVIVPVVGQDEYYLAGSYDRPLRFTFEGKILSGEPINLEGNPLSPGDVWVGPHPGIPYVLCAGGKDIRYSAMIRPCVEKTYKLTKIIGAENAQQTIQMIKAVKGFAGGSFYVNEFCSIFAPVMEQEEVEYLYIGKLDLDVWFPMWSPAEPV